MQIINDRKTINQLKSAATKKIPVVGAGEEDAQENIDASKNVGFVELFSKVSKPKADVKEALKRLLPRGPESFIAVNAKTGKKIATDSAIKPAMYDSDLPEEMVPFFSYSFIGWQACALLYQNPYIKKACEIPARDAVAVDYKIQYAHVDKDQDESTDDTKEQEILDNLKKISDKEMKIKALVRDANVFKKVYGQIVLIPTFNTDMDEAMGKEYTPSAIKKGTYTGLVAVQPFWITYQLNADAVATPTAKDFYEPEYYIVRGNKKIHKSWVIKLTNGAMPDILKPVYYYGGVPLTQQIFERVFCAEKTANEAPKLALTKRLTVIDGSVENLVANPESAFSTMQNVLDWRDNMGLLIKNPGDNVAQLDTSLTDFDSLIMTQYQLVAAIAEMPATKLMKTQLKGLANTGDYEMRDYSQSLVEIQENDFTTIMDKHFEYLTLSEYGKIIEVNIVWNPIDTPSEKEKAEIESVQAQTDAAYVQMGAIDASEVRDTLRTNDDSRFHNLSEEMPEPDYSGLEQELPGEENDNPTPGQGEDADDIDDDESEDYQTAYAVEGVEL